MKCRRFKPKDLARVDRSKAARAKYLKTTRELLATIEGFPRLSEDLTAELGERICALVEIRAFHELTARQGGLL